MNEVLRTLKASPLNSQVVHSTPGYDKCIASTLKESPNYAVGAPLQGAYITPCTVSVGAPAAYPRLLRGDAFSVFQPYRSNVFDLGVPGPSGNENDTYVADDAVYKIFE